MVNYNKLYSLFYYIGMGLSIVLTAIIGLWIFSYLFVMAFGGLLIVVDMIPVSFQYGGYFGMIMGGVFTVVLVWSHIMFRLLDYACEMWRNFGEGLAIRIGIVIVDICPPCLKGILGD